MAAQRIHIVGIGGSGASGVARYLHAIGFKVSGSDIQHERTVALKKLGLRIADVHESKNIQSPDLVLFSPGVYAAQKELRAAQRKGIPVLSWQEFLGRFLTRRPGKGLMVAGTYGKGSTAAILAHILDAAYLDPLAILGVEDISWNSNVRMGFGTFWILEADEYNRHFHHFHPSYAALTSLQHEHVSTYPTFVEYVDAFQQFFEGMREPRVVVARHGAAPDEIMKKVLPVGTITYGVNGAGDIQATVLEESLSGSRFELSAPSFGVNKKELELKVPGRIHVENAVGAIALALSASIPFSAVNAGLATFKGLKRRFEVVQKGELVTVFDYAHTPDRIRAVIEQVRRLFQGRRIVALFEPHLYSRTKQLLTGFQEVLARVDRVYVTDIYPAREARSKLAKEIHSTMLTKDGDDRSIYAGTLEEGIAAVERARTERDVVLVLGAGPIQDRASRLGVN